MKKKLFWWLFLFVFLTTFYLDLSKTNLSEFFIIKNFEIKKHQKYRYWFGKFQIRKI